MRVVVWWQAQALFQRTALQPVHRHDYVQFIHGCVMTRASSRRSRVVYGKLSWTGETSHTLPCDTVASAATVVRPDALPCPQFLGQRGPSAQARMSFQIVCLPLVEAGLYDAPAAAQPNAQSRPHRGRKKIPLCLFVICRSLTSVDCSLLPYAAWYRVHRVAGVTCRLLSACFAASQEAARHELRTRQEQELQVTHDPRDASAAGRVPGCCVPYGAT